MSIDALVVARRNGGVSWTVAGAAFGIVMSLWSDMKRPSASSSLCVTDSSFARRRVIGLNGLEDLRRRSLWIEEAGGVGERRLVVPQIFFRDRQELIERQREHLVGGELLPESVLADGKVAVRPFQQVALQPLLVVVERGDDGVVGLLEFGEERLVGHGGKGRRDRRPEEVTVAVDLLDCDLGVDPRRIVEVLARLGERGGHGLLPRDQLTQALVRRRERPLDHDVGGVGQTAAVAVRITRPWPDGLERQHARVDRQKQLLAVELIRRRQRRGIDGCNTIPKLACRGHLVEHRLPGRIAQ